MTRNETNAGDILYSLVQSVRGLQRQKEAQSWKENDNWLHNRNKTKLKNILLHNLTFFKNGVLDNLA
jgi:hypothetical protein